MVGYEKPNQLIHLKNVHQILISLFLRISLRIRDVSIVLLQTLGVDSSHKNKILFLVVERRKNWTRSPQFKETGTMMDNQIYLP